MTLHDSLNCFKHLLRVKCCVKLTMFQNDPNSGVTKSKSGTTKVSLSLQVKLPQDSNLEGYY